MTKEQLDDRLVTAFRANEQWANDLVRSASHAQVADLLALARLGLAAKEFFSEHGVILRALRRFEREATDIHDALLGARAAEALEPLLAAFRAFGQEKRDDG